MKRHDAIFGVLIIVGVSIGMYELVISQPYPSRISVALVWLALIAIYEKIEKIEK